MNTPVHKADTKSVQEKTLMGIVFVLCLVEIWCTHTIK